tara:strand:+ start:277 stop:453 length:177 start_codon:yes stop_codon:yes gene_type:complete
MNPITRSPEFPNNFYIIDNDLSHLNHGITKKLLEKYKPKKKHNKVKTSERISNVRDAA